MAVLFILISLSIDVIAHVLNFAVALVNSSIKLHLLLSRVLQVLLEVSDLARKFALRRAILSILFLNLWKVLELNSLSLEDTSLHILDKHLLLLFEQIILKLHSMDFLLHHNDFSLTNGWVQSVLHFFLKLVLAVPEKNLLLSIDDVDQNITLLLLKLSDLILQLDRLVFHLLQLLLELHFDVKVVIGKFLLSFIVLVNQVIELVHFKDLVLLGDFELTDFLLMSINLGIDPNFFLIQDRLLGSQVIVLTVNLRFLFLTLDELDLVGDPVFLDIGCLVINFFDLLLDVVSVVLGRAHEFVTVTTSLKIGALTVKLIDLESLFLNA